MIRRRIPVDAFAATADACWPMPAVAVSMAAIHGCNPRRRAAGRLSALKEAAMILAVHVCADELASKAGAGTAVAPMERVARMPTPSKTGFCATP